MRVNISERGLTGLARRLAMHALEPAVVTAARGGAQELAQDIAEETGVMPHVTGAPQRPRVQVNDEAVLARLRGGPGVEGEPVLDRIRLDFHRRKRGRRA